MTLSLNSGTGQNLLNQGKQTLALAVTNLAVVQLGAAAVGIDQGLTQNLLGLTNGILLHIAVVGVNSNLDNIFHIRHYMYLLS